LCNVVGPTHGLELVINVEKYQNIPNFGGNIGVEVSRIVWIMRSFFLSPTSLSVFIARQHSNSDTRYWYNSSVCLSVRPSVAFRYCIDRLNMWSYILQHKVAQPF